MVRHSFLSIPFGVPLVLMLLIPNKSFADLYKSKQDCLEKNSAGSDIKMIDMLCDSLVYPPTEKEKKEILKREKQRDKQREEAYQDVLERRREEKQRQMEQDPNYQKEKRKQELIYKCKTIKNDLQEKYSKYTVNGKKVSPDSSLINAQMPVQCWGLWGL